MNPALEANRAVALDLNQSVTLISPPLRSSLQWKPLLPPSAALLPA